MRDPWWKKLEAELYEPPAEDPSQCKHPKATPVFDSAASQGLDADVVRQRWPRFKGTCPDCGASVICYASFEHYMAGDW